MAVNFFFYENSSLGQEDRMYALMSSCVRILNNTKYKALRDEFKSYLCTTSCNHYVFDNDGPDHNLYVVDQYAILRNLADICEILEVSIGRFMMRPILALLATVYELPAFVFPESPRDGLRFAGKIDKIFEEWILPFMREDGSMDTFRRDVQK